MTPQEVKVTEGYKAKAENGDRMAQFILGLCYAKGVGVAEDQAEAAKWYLKAAEQEYALAQNRMALCYVNGSGVVYNFDKAISWGRKAAEMGDARAQFFLAGFYWLKEDYAQCAAWTRKAAENGLAQAQFNLGAHYSDGVGVEQDFTQAASWRRKAAEQGIIRGIYTFRAFPDEVDDVTSLTVDELKVFGEYRETLFNEYKAEAEKGNAAAQFKLGVMYHQGEGVLKDIVQAISWLSLIHI